MTHLPIRGIQILLIAAFFADVVASAMQFFPILTDEHALSLMAGTMSDYSARFLKDLAYATFYLGEAALIELLVRIWNSHNNPARPVESTSE